MLGDERLVVHGRDHEPMAEPSGSSNATLSSSRTADAERRSSQKSSAASEPTRHWTVWTIPAPARPGRAPGYSKNVMSLPGVPSSSA